MADSRLVDELVIRAKVSAADAEAVVDALAQLAVEGRFGHAHGSEGDPVSAGPAGRPDPAGAASEASPAEPFVPSAEQVDALIAAARLHPLGIDFLLSGHLDAVAGTFRAHAFTVEAARERVWSQR